jgi:NADH:ubiquinone oxidoreductase subunit 5 (subunit L)/multisubunit Na+/H+ antiporter MnhA subunit
VSRFLYTASLNKWYFDDLNNLIFYRFGGVVANSVMWFDVKIIDGVVNGVGSVTQSVGDGIRHVQTGRVQNYALGIAIGLIVITVLFILMAR